VSQWAGSLQFARHKGCPGGGPGCRTLVPFPPSSLVPRSVPAYHDKTVARPTGWITQRLISMEKALSISIFLLFGLGFVLVNLLVGSIVRPRIPNAEKEAIYECGEPTIGSSWVQFDLRFYIVALFYLVFDVEVALIYPWAVVFRDAPGAVLALGAPFIGIIVVGYAYEWYSGSLDWVRSSINTSFKGTNGIDMASLSRRDPEALKDEVSGLAGHG